MAIGKSNPSVTLDDILSKTTEADILAYYLGVTEIPCVIHSPLRIDNKASFGLYSRDGHRVYYVDFATKDRGNTFDILCKLWGCNYIEALAKIAHDISKFSTKDLGINTSKQHLTPKIFKLNNTELQCKVRDWAPHDIEYWASYGISLDWLKYAEVYPISHRIVIKDGNKYAFGADRYAYAYVEHKEGKVTLKIYQPKNTKGYKWSNKHDKSVISLWTKIPEYGDKVCICSSLKDALCLWSNLGIPALSIQGEGYNMSNTAVNELKRRYKEIYILLDNDEAGLKDGLSLSESTGFINLVLPKFKEGKDISDAYKVLGKERWLKLIKPLFFPSESEDDLPFYC